MEVDWKVESVGVNFTGEDGKVKWDKLSKAKLTS